MKPPNKKPKNTQKQTKKNLQHRALPRPTEIKTYLDQHVVGQERAKKIMAVAVHNHYKRILFQDLDDGVKLEKSNILVLGCLLYTSPSQRDQRGTRMPASA